MVKPHRLCMFVAALGLLSWVNGSAAQFALSVRAASDGGSRSHRPVATKRDTFAERFQPPDGDPEEILAKRLLLREIAGEMKAKGVQPEHLDLLLKKYPNFPHDLKEYDVRGLPQPWADLLKGMNTADLRQKFGSINLDALKEQLGGKVLGERPGTSAAGKPPTLDGPGPEPSRSVPPGSQSGAPAPPPAPVETLTATGEPGEQGETPEPFAERFLSWAKRLQKLDPALKDSPALSQAIEGLSRYAGGEDGRWERMASAARSTGARLAQWGRNLGLDRVANQERLRWPRGMARPALPNFRLPHIEAPFGNRSSVNVPHLGRPSGSRDASWPILAGAAALVLVVVIVWKMWERSHHARSAAAGDRELGPWPVEPHAVVTPQELVLAFEYLSVLRLGTAARNWNHRAIAASLGRATAATGLECEHCRAADELADLYELARYAPPSDPLPPGALVAARRDLCLLAGTSVA